jgi:ketosteroid isomerase-like protein
MTDTIVAEIRRREDERGQALLNADWAALASLMADDLVHIHATGLVDDKTTYLDGARTKLDYLRFERKSYDVRVHGDIAVATGLLDQQVRIKGPGTVVDVQAATTQVWIKKDSAWVQSSFQATRIG